ncbi:uncharacterized protein B0H64DRAFT_398735 [Chaetomium fimeti]|uniref:Uncharacterized protein n=1 Tax=Chaetomium fimeti TaxID=1854472 RepID=A0AAE0LQ78_9PEZI|nr:hypothetical protein B0H64DRAFT_398735 [Chaetomium fimeti]
MALLPVQLVRPSALQIDADTPCVLAMHIPITLPHQLDPSVPAPPYHLGIIGAEAGLSSHAIPVLRRLMAEIVSRLFGPEHATDALKASDHALPTPGARHLRLMSEFDSSLVIDRENGFNLAAGYYKDQYGDEGHGPIDAYVEDVGGHIVILHGFVLYLVRGVRDARELVEINPRVLRFDLEGEGRGALGHELVFGVKEYTETSRRLLIPDELAILMSTGDSIAAGGHRL